MICERVKLFIVKHRITILIIVIVMLTVVAFFSLKTGYRYYVGITGTTKVIVGTLLGAIVGGCFTLAGSIAVNRNIQKAANAVRRKNLIYKPLYDELMETHSTAKEDWPSPSRITFKKRESLWEGTLQYTVWGRIKKDTRLFDVPHKLQKKMDELYLAIEQYIKSWDRAVASLDVIYRECYQQHTGDTIDKRANPGQFFLPDILSGHRPNSNSLMWNHNSDDNNYADGMWEMLLERIKYDNDINNLKDAKKIWDDNEEGAIELLGIYIQYIMIKYEA